MQNDSQKLSKWVPLFPGWRLLGALWRPNPLFDTKGIAKVLQKWPQGCKSDPKVLQKWPQGRKIDSKRGAKVVKVHQALSAARYHGPVDCAKRFK